VFQLTLVHSTSEWGSTDATFHKVLKRERWVVLPLRRARQFATIQHPLYAVEKFLTHDWGGVQSLHRFRHTRRVDPACIDGLTQQGVKRLRRQLLPTLRLQPLARYDFQDLNLGVLAGRIQFEGFAHEGRGRRVGSDVCSVAQLQIVDVTERRGPRPSARADTGSRAIFHLLRQRVGEVLIKDAMNARRHAARRCVVKVWFRHGEQSYPILTQLGKGSTLIGTLRAKLKRERWTASVTYVFRENVKNKSLP
jgi:hypothetical protein